MFAFYSLSALNIVGQYERCQYFESIMLKVVVCNSFCGMGQWYMVFNTFMINVSFEISDTTL